MIGSLVLAAVLVVAGALLLAASAGRQRPGLYDAIREIDGAPSQVGRRWRGVVFALAGLVLLVAGPFWLLDAGVPWPAVVVVGLLVVGVLGTMVVELRLRLRGRGTAVVVPLTFGWQRRLSARLVRGLTAMWPVPPLRRVAPSRGQRPTAAASVRSDTRLLVVRLPDGAPGLRLWDVAEQYLGSRLRYRDLLALNRYRSAPTGEMIGDDSVISNGWTLLVPGDARGPGLVTLPAPTGDRLGRTPSAVVAVDPEVADVPATEPPGGAGPDQLVPPVEREQLDELDELDATDAPVPEPAGYPPAQLAWDLVHARLLADGLTDTLDGLRERRHQHRPEGLNVPLPDAGAVMVEESAHVGADPAGAGFLELALRLFADVCGTRDTPWPEIVSAHLDEDRLELRFAAPDREPVAPFEASESGSRWFLDRRTALDDVPDVSPRLPGLVSLGPDHFGRLLVNLPAGGVISLEGAPAGCRLVALAIAVELVVKRWSEAPLVNLVGFGAELAEFSPRLRYNARISQVLDRPVRGDVVVLAEPPTDAALAALRVGAGSDWFSAPAVIVIGEHRRARWRLQLSPAGLLSCPELDFTVGAQALSEQTAAALARLASTERTTELPAVRSSTVLVPRPVDADAAEVVLRLFGEPCLTRGAEVVTATARSVEIVAFVGVLGGRTPDEIAAALWPHGVDRHTVHTALYEAAMTLGDSAAGLPLLRLGDTVELAAEVQVDWHLFVAAAGAGDDAAALALLRRSDPRRGLRHYPWMARSPLVRQLPGYVVDVASRHDRRRNEIEARRGDRQPDRLADQPGGDPRPAGSDTVLTVPAPGR